MQVTLRSSAMQSITQQLSERFRSAIQGAFPALSDDIDPMIAVSQNEKFGDYQSNAAMGLAKTLKSNPRAVATAIQEKLELSDLADETSIAGAGFINVKLKASWLASQLRDASLDPHLGVAKVERPQTVVVDYSGPNVAKQMHVGHLRSTIIGDAISRVLEFRGDDVIRRNHIGDWGTQFGMLIAFLKAQGPLEALTVVNLEAMYRQAKARFDADPNFAEESRKQVVALQAGDVDALAAWGKYVDATRREYEPTYRQLNVKLTRQDEFGESFYNPLLPAVVADLKKFGLAEESEGATVVFIDGKEEGKTPLIIEKSGGGYLYGTTDLAAVRQRINDLHATRLIYTHDSRQANHFRQVFETARRAGWAGPETSLEYAPFGTMLGADGRPFKTRSGDTVKLKDLLDEAESRALAMVSEKNPTLPKPQRNDIARAVGIGAVKYADLSKDRISDYVFDWNKMLSFDGNTGPYLQYAYARIRSIFRKAERSMDSIDTPITLESPFELSLAKHLLRFGEVIDAVARELKPHLLCAYLYDAATRFSGFFENCPVIQSEEPMRSSRLALCAITARTLAIGLDLLGIEHPEQM